MDKVILSVLGYDRPGIVAAIANVLFDQNCNIENVSQTILQTEFAGLFIVTLPSNLALDNLRNILNDKLAQMAMHVHVKPLADKAPALAATACEPFVITTKGPDPMSATALISAACSENLPSYRSATGRGSIDLSAAAV
ncbi:MAG: ACT domain-containing protein [Desulfobacterales bacterium]|jgi:glycine cleavage system transcriptional repressor